MKNTAQESYIKIYKLFKTIWKCIGETLKLMGIYPKSTLGSALAIAGTLAIANRLHPAHQMFREETKNKILKDQNKILLKILKKEDKIVAKPKKQKLIIPPLT